MAPEMAVLVKHLLTFPMLQRWVGVNYCPDTEYESHYGEVIPRDPI
jgi:hypothetical protein